ncbi:hypothetical protein [uncultured Sunxiuqinia sp.]|uniref:hypothetical protein n=1 Tax=uncultured Sunxiuqinia sp. TaxID=1573825 RepID=UPI002615635D|nr:hypothetical protein [uncultured Sunxiuqinia sp.]
MIRTLVFVIFVLLVRTGSAQELFRIPARFRSLGNASVSLQSPLAVFSNPAGFASETTMAFGAQYENRFMLSELSIRSAFLLLPVGQTNFGGSFSQFGASDYHEDKLSLGVAKRLSSRFSAAVQFHYFSLKLPENRQRATTVIADLGAQYQLADDFWLGAQVFNPHELAVEDLHLELDYPMVLRLGAHKTFDNLLLVAFELKKHGEQALGVSSGMELQLKKQLQLRVGIETQWSLFSMGVGYSLKGIQTDLTFSYHQYLGYSPSFSIYYQLP